MIALRSRHRAVIGKDQKSRGGSRIEAEIPRCKRIRVSRRPVQVKRPQAARQSAVLEKITEKVK